MPFFLRLVPPRFRGSCSATICLLTVAQCIWTGATWAADDAVARPHCGLVIDPALQQSAATSLFEASMLQNEKIISVERVENDKLLGEEQLEAMFSPDAVGKRSKFGQKVKADLLVMVRDATAVLPGPADRAPHSNAAKERDHRIDLIVCETKHGLRLAVSTIAVSSDPKADAASLQSAFNAALARFRQNIRQIIAVPPFASQDLTHDFDYLEEAYPRLIGQALLQRPGVLVVEISEAKALTDELTLTNGADIRRQLPLYLNGKFRHEGVGDALRVMINLELKRGDQSLGKREIAKVQPSVVAGQLISDADKLMKSAPDAPPHPAGARVDNTIEAGELTSQAKNFDRVGDWRQARVLAEASLLLDSHQPELHAVAFRALNELAEASSGRWSVIRPEGVPAALAYFRQSLPHLEAYLDGTAIDIHFGDGKPDFDIGRYWLTVHMQAVRNRPPAHLWREANDEATAVVWRALHRKSEARIEDDTAELCFDQLASEPFRKIAGSEGHNETDAQVKAALDMRLGLLKEFAYRENLEGLFSCVFRCQIVNYDDPRWLQYLRDAGQATSNPKIAERAAMVLSNDLKLAEKARAWQAEQKRDKAAPDEPAQAAKADDEVRFEPVTFKNVKLDQDIPSKAIRIIGCMRAGPGVDIFWTNRLIFTMRQEGMLEYTVGCAPPRPKQDADPHPENPSRLWIKRDSGCFDGRLAWFFVELSPVRDQMPKAQWTKYDLPDPIVESALIAYDPESKHLYWLGKSEGLPPFPNAIAPIAPGKVCVAGSFDRTWCAIVSIDAGAAPVTPSLKVIYEAREVIPLSVRDRPENELSIAYPIEYLRTLAPVAPAALERGHGPLPRVLARRHGPGFLIINPNNNSVEKFPDPLLQTYFTYVFDSGVYFEGTGPQGKVCIRRSNFADPFPKDNGWAAPLTQLLADQGVMHMMDFKHHQWLVSRDGTPPFRVLRGYVPGNDFAAGTVTITNHYGLTIVGNGDNHDLVKVVFPKPLPETAK